VEEDVRRLAASLMGHGPESLDLYRRFRTLYEAAQFKDLVTEATRAWDTHADHPTAALAECCRLASLSLLKTGDSQAVPLWRARAIAVAYKSGSSNSLAATLFSMFFQLLDYGDYEGAEGVLREVDRLTAEGDDYQVPGRDVMRRTYHEKSGYMLFLRGQYEDSIGRYERALQDSGQDRRGACKVRGGLANAKFMLRSVAAAVELAQGVLDEARLNDWREEAEAAEHNLNQMRSGTHDLRPYEVT
jgi:tetratricopeptide (TPR) repeat protein